MYMPCQQLCQHNIPFVKDYANTVSALSMTTPTPYLSCQGLCKTPCLPCQWQYQHCIHLVNNYANTVSALLMTVPKPYLPMAMPTLYLPCQWLFQHRIRLVKNYANTVSALSMNMPTRVRLFNDYDNTVSSLSWAHVDYADTYFSSNDFLSLVTFTKCVFWLNTTNY